MTTYTSAPRTRRRGRPPAGQALVSRDRIIDAALELADARGADALSMRAVAQRLDVDPKSLYNHVTDKEDLLDAISQRIIESIQMPAATGNTDQDLRAFADAFRRGTCAHPQLTTLVLTRGLTSLAGLAPVQDTLAVLRRAGHSPEQSVHVMRLMLAALTGAILRDVSAAPIWGARDDDFIARRRAALEASGLPDIVEAAPYLARFDPDTEFDAALDLLVAAFSHP